MNSKGRKQSAAASVAALLIFFHSLPAWCFNYTAADFAANPNLISGGGVEPLLMINFLVGESQQAEAYTDGEQVYVQNGTFCPGRTAADEGICYSSAETYIGYFDPEKCYDYEPGVAADANQHSLSPELTNAINPPHFYPVGNATNHVCSGFFSGNFMNWASMTALDAFRYSMTGGARLLDSHGALAKTILARTLRKPALSSTNASAPLFVTKKIDSAGISVAASNGTAAAFTNNPGELTPFTTSRLIVKNQGADTNTISFEDGSGLTLSYKGLNRFHVNVRVCDQSVGLEPHCVQYGDGSNTWHKPEGLLQKHAQQMRFALSSYTSKPGNSVYGGVLRASAKYLGYQRPSSNGGVEVNPKAEINQHGQFNYDPDGLAGTVAGVSNSGIINYINNVGLGVNGYPQSDSAAELYSESLRYLKGEAAATNEYVSGLSPADYDAFPVIKAWDDPLQDACQANYMLTFGDQFIGEHRNVTGAVNASAYTQTLGVLENMPPGFGPGFQLAGLAYYANTQDIRPDLPGDQFVTNFVVDAQEYRPNAPILERNVLWLTAKYGGFRDFNNNGDPNNGNPDNPGDALVEDSNPKWDADRDGNPDTYTLANQPANLLQGLADSFSQIDAVVGAGSSAGRVSNTLTTGSMVIQALFKPSVSDNLGNHLSWGGIVQALFIDAYGNVREDSDGNGELTDADAVITYVTDPITEQVQALRSSTGDGGQTFGAFNGSAGLNALVNMEDLKAVWNARDILADLQNNNGQMRVQRPYANGVSNANPSRYIFTALDLNYDGLVVPASIAGADTELDFTAANFPAVGTNAAPQLQNNFRLLGLKSQNGHLSEDIVNFVRGEEITGMRSRKVDYDADGVEEVWRLGDIVSSSPLLLGPPLLQQRYDLIYGDESYKAFYEKYRNRRQVVFAGANDGMIHAFNAGFYDASTKRFSRQLNGETAHPLGAELWAYVPYNVLPHLQWSTEFNYQHVFYVDGDPQTFDVNIFADDADHPGGWGTILVIGMRLGGGEYLIDPNSDPGNDLRDDITLRSSYVVLDVTNPESPPQLIAEISHENMGYTMSRPTVIKARRPAAGSNNFAAIPSGGDQWFLVMGSGPFGADAAGRTDALQRAVSEQKAKVFFFDLQAKNFVSFGTEQYLQVPDVDNGFTGDFITMDWDRDFVDDAVYFGTVTNDNLNDPTGDFWRLPLNAGTGLLGSVDAVDFSRTVENGSGSLGLPVSGRAYAYKYRGKHWVAFGTGRFYVDDDSASQKQMRFFGFKEPVDSAGNFTWGSVDIASGEMIDVTHIQPQFIENTQSDPWDGKIFDARNGLDSVTLSTGVSVDNYPEYRDTLHQLNPGGWYYDFESPFAKQIGGVVGEGPVITFSEYVSKANSANACSSLGTSSISQLYIGTGHAAPFFGLNKRVQLYGEEIQQRQIQGGEAILGLVKEPAKPVDGDSVAQSNTGEIIAPFKLDELLFKSGLVSWREIPVTWK
ncbi:MAG: hypothetical protein KTR17_10085 [Cellvibrionaceae bacterium]|nr:hypothetical protein [Cellvibrionaceae bacterium]